jgi:hypothetical protein
VLWAQPAYVAGSVLSAQPLSLVTRHVLSKPLLADQTTSGFALMMMQVVTPRPTMSARPSTSRGNDPKLP